MPDSQETKTIATPKVFVSYAQSEERTSWISDVCERLMHDGVDVVVDLYELPHSADIHAFMERCVNDPSITRVLMFCDALYCEKANDRRGGVGKETQIISEEVYNNIGRTKFLPIFCAVYDDGRPCLPIYLKSRLAIDFSTPEKVQENWETLLRDLFEQPLHQKPALGTPPAYITTPQLPSRPAASKFASWRQAANRGAATALSLFQQYLETVIEEKRDLYLTQNDAEKLENELDEKLERWAPIRDELLEAFAHFAGEPPDKSSEAIASTLERLLPFKFAPDPLSRTGWPTIACESPAICVYELFLRTVARLLSLNAFMTLAALLRRLYVVPANERHQWGNLARFTIFYDESHILANKNQRRQLKRYDLLADLIKERCGPSSTVFQTVREADLLLALRSIVHRPSLIWWYPRTLIYSPHQVLPLFARAEQHQHFKILCDLIEVTDKGSLVDALTAAEQNHIGILFQGSMSPTSVRTLTNLDKLDALP
jgi:TIR domain